MEIHPTAVVDAGATIEAGAVVGPFCVVGEGARIAAGAVLESHVSVTGETAIGEGTRIGAFTAVGGPPQDLSYRGEPTRVEIGRRVTIRENVSVHRGTARGRGVTTVGDGCYLMAGSHVAHDCALGAGVIVSNNVMMGGHTTIGDNVIIGGGAAIRQRLRIGANAFVSGISGLAKDVIPYGYVIGYRGRLDGLNLVGLKRSGVPREEIRALMACYRELFAEEGTFQERFGKVMANAGDSERVAEVVRFILDGGSRPLLTPREQDDL